MPLFIDITDKKKLIDLLSLLTPASSAQWGRLNAQEMVEHLVEAVQYTNGKRTARLAFSEEKALEQKQSAIYSDTEIPRGVAGHLSDATLQRRCPDLSSAISGLIGELDDFHTYFRPPGTTAIHPAFGAMDYKEWIAWHGKHFTHHFKQFGLAQ